MALGNEQINNENLDKVWYWVSNLSIDQLREGLPFVADGLLALLIYKITQNSDLEIGTFRTDKEEGSIVTYDIYDSSKELSLQVMADNCPVLVMDLEDEDGNFCTIRHILTPEQKLTVPKMLRDLMLEVALTKRSLTIDTRKL